MRVVRRHRAQALKRAEMRTRLSGDVELNLTRHVKSIIRFLFLYFPYSYTCHVFITSCPLMQLRIIKILGSL